MQKVEAEGIVLRSIDYLKSQKIITLFTKEQGLISLMVHGISSRNLTKVNLCSPLSRGFFKMERGSSNFHLYRDGALLDLHLFLRNDWRALACSCDFVNALLKSQLFEKPSPLLYDLFLSYLGSLKESPHYAHLKASFLLKILKHEGLYHNQSPYFSSSEREIVSYLAEVRLFKEIARWPLSKELEGKISDFFDSCIA